MRTGDSVTREKRRLEQAKGTEPARTTCSLEAMQSRLLSNVLASLLNTAISRASRSAEEDEDEQRSIHESVPMPIPRTAAPLPSPPTF